MLSPFQCCCSHCSEGQSHAAERVFIEHLRPGLSGTAASAFATCPVQRPEEWRFPAGLVGGVGAPCPRTSVLQKQIGFCCPRQCCCQSHQKFYPLQLLHFFSVFFPLCFCYPSYLKTFFFFILGSQEMFECSLCSARLPFELFSI